MKTLKLLKKMENLFSAITFAQAGEWETALNILDDEKELNKKRKVKIFKLSWGFNFFKFLL